MQDEGVLAKILVEASGNELACGEPIALIVDDKEAYATFLTMDPSSYSTSPSPSVVAPPTSASESTIPQNSKSKHARFSPAAKHMIQSAGLSVSDASSKIVGTAKHGLISKSDVVLARSSGSLKQAATSAPSAAPTVVAVLAAVSTPSSPAPSLSPTPAGPVNERFTDIPNSNMRKIIAKRLAESKATVPHLYLTMECEIDSLLLFRQQLKKQLDVAVSVNDLVIKSAALALRDVPRANARWNAAAGSVQSGEGKVDISVAVATPNGLITPIVTAADRRGVASIGQAVKDLAGRAREGKLKPEEFQGGSFSVSNLGMFGIAAFSAVINPPQACILAVGAGLTKVLPPLQEGQGPPRVATTVTVQLSADRRVVDEATAAEFLQVFRKYFSNPQLLLL